MQNWKSYIEEWKDPDFGVTYQRTWYVTKWRRLYSASDVQKYWLVLYVWRCLTASKQQCWVCNNALKYMRKFISKPSATKVNQHSKLQKKNADGIQVSSFSQKLCSLKVAQPEFLWQTSNCHLELLVRSENLMLPV